MNSEHLLSINGCPHTSTSSPDKKSLNENKLLLFFFSMKTTGQRSMLAIKLTSTPKRHTEGRNEPVKTHRQDTRLTVHLLPHLRIISTSLAYSSRLQPKNKIWFTARNCFVFSIVDNDLVRVILKSQAFIRKKLHPVKEPGVWSEAATEHTNIEEVLRYIEPKKTLRIKIR